MKKEISPISPDELLKTHPINDQLDGWFFRITEKSAGVYEAEGRDEWGHVVKHGGFDATRVLHMCVDSAQTLSSSGLGNQKN